MLNIIKFKSKINIFVLFFIFSINFLISGCKCAYVTAESKNKITFVLVLIYIDIQCLPPLSCLSVLKTIPKQCLFEYPIGL